MNAPAANPLIVPPPGPRTTPPHFLADLYTFQWKSSTFRLPLVSATAVAACLLAGVLSGHPGVGLVAGGGAFTVGFGANQRIRDSRLIPMIAAVIGVALGTLLGTLAGHRSYALVLAASAFAFFYGILTARHSGLSWVGQQSTVALLVASAFPTGPAPAFARAGLLAAGGLVQLLATTAGLHLLRNLPRDTLAIPVETFHTVENQNRELLRRLRRIPKSLPPLSHVAALGYAARLAITVLIATEIDRRSGVQSGYWIPMTALLVQKPAFFETLTRAAARILGTVAAASLCSLILVHAAPSPLLFALATALFALGSYVSNSVNYALFVACLTGYIIFLLSLNAVPGPLIAERRAWCTAAGAVLALLIHLDALRRHRSAQKTGQPRLQALR